jgi:DNA-binding NarL/FixJ family response regulator
MSEAPSDEKLAHTARRLRRVALCAGLDDVALTKVAHLMKEDSSMHMQPTTTILLISAPHANWTGLQVMLRRQRRFQIIGEAQEGDEAMRAIAVEQPDVIIAASDLPDIPIVSLVREVRAVHSASRIVVVGRLRTRMEHVELTALGVCGFVLWKDIDAESVEAILALARRGMRVASEAAMERRDTPEPEPERRRRPRASDITLTDEERGVLRGKVTGLVEREIAVELHTSVPTVERILRGLRNKLDVVTTCALCAKAVSLDLVIFDA